MRRSRPHRRRKPRPQDIGECQNQQTSLITTCHFGLSRAGLRRQAVRPAANWGLDRSSRNTIVRRPCRESGSQAPGTRVCLFPDGA